MERVATLDFESRSQVSLRERGSWRYAEDPTTEVLCLAFRLPDWPAGETGLWVPAFPHLGIPEAFDDPVKGALLTEWIATGHPVEAHNAWFERGLWYHKMRRRGFPAITDTQWRCSMAKASMCALPRKLEGAIEALHLTVHKDLEGAALMRKLVTPRSPLKKERDAWMRAHAACLTCAGKGKLKVGRAKATPCPACDGVGWFGTLADVPRMPVLWHESVELFERLWAYCRQDVLAEEALSHALLDLPPAELHIYHLDQQMNERGFRLDREAVDTALVLLGDLSADANAELARLTGGVVTRVSQRARIQLWLDGQCCALPDTQGPTLDEALAAQDLPAHVRAVLVTLRALGKSSTAKYETMQDWMCVDDRVRGGLLYHGASTGRWTGVGIQPQNFPRGVVEIKDMEAAWATLKTLDPAQIATLGPPMSVLSSALRGVIVPSPGHELCVADFAAIEARVLCWLADQTDALERFARNEDPYIDMASDLYGRGITKADKGERQLGKAAVLGCGYQMGPSKFVDTAASYGVTLIEDIYCAKCGTASKQHRRERHAFKYLPGDQAVMTAVRVVDTYRDKYWCVRELWATMEQAALAAADHPGTVQSAGYVSWHADDTFLTCTLPSGRRLYYPFPDIKMKKTPWGELREQLTFMGVDPYTRQWKRQSTYGGSLVENCLAGDTLVLTQYGWTPLYAVTRDHQVWDGVQWVAHNGLSSRGVQLTLDVCGVRMTPEHQVLTTKGWRHASQSAGHYRADVRLPHGAGLRGQQWPEVTLARALCLRDAACGPGNRPVQGASSVVRVPAAGVGVPRPVDARAVETPRVSRVEFNEGPMWPSLASGLCQLWRAGHQRMRGLAAVLRRLLGGHGAELPSRVQPRPTGQRRALFPGELPLDDAHRAREQSPEQCTAADPVGAHDGCASGRPIRYWRHDVAVPDNPRRTSGRLVLAPGRAEPVYDLLNCGPRRRFTVRDGSGRPLLVHNCTQAVARDLMAAAMVRCAESAVYTPILTVHDELIAEAPVGQGNARDFEALMAALPSWAAGCPVAAEGWIGPRYRK